MLSSGGLQGLPFFLYWEQGIFLTSSSPLSSAKQLWQQTLAITGPLTPKFCRSLGRHLHQKKQLSAGIFLLKLFMLLPWSSSRLAPGEGFCSHCFPFLPWLFFIIHARAPAGRAAAAVVSITPLQLLFLQQLQASLGLRNHSTSSSTPLVQLLSLPDTTGAAVNDTPEPGYSLLPIRCCSCQCWCWSFRARLAALGLPFGIGTCAVLSVRGSLLRCPRCYFHLIVTSWGLIHIFYPKNFP